MAYDDEEDKARRQTPEEDESQAKIEDLTKGQDELAHADMHSPFDAAHDVAEMVGNTAKVAKEDDSHSDAPIGESPSGDDSGSDDDNDSGDSLTALKASKKALDAILAEPSAESDDSPKDKVGDSGAGSGGAGPWGIFKGMAEKSMLGAAQPGSAPAAAPDGKSAPTFDAATGNMAPTPPQASNPNQDLRAQVQRMMLEKAKSQLSGGDQGLQDAMKKSQLLDAMKPLSNIGAMGDNLANYMAARAGVHNLNSHTPPPGDSDEPVKRYLAMRHAQNQPVDEARKALAEADKSDEQVVANKIRGQNADSSTTRAQTGVKAETERESSNKAKQDLDAKKEKDMESYHRGMLYNGAIAARSRGDLATARTLMAQLGQTKYRDQVSGVNRSGITYDNPAAQAHDTKGSSKNADMKASTDRLGDLVSGLKALKDPNTGYESLPNSTKDALEKEFYTLIQPMATVTGGFQSFTKGHQELATHLLNDPANFRSALNAGAIDAQLDELLSEAHSSLAHQLEVSPGHGRETPKGKIAPAPKLVDGKWQEDSAAATPATSQPASKIINGKPYKKVPGGWVPAEM